MNREKICLKSNADNCTVWISPIVANVQLDPGARAFHGDPYHGYWASNIYGMFLLHNGIEVEVILIIIFF